MSENEQRWAYGLGRFWLELFEIALERGDTELADARLAEAERMAAVTS